MVAYHEERYQIAAAWSLRPGDKIFLGDKDNRKCRCCGKTEPEVCFCNEAHQLTNLSAELATVGSRDTSFPTPHDRGDQVIQAGGGPDPRELPPKGVCARDSCVPDLHIDTIKGEEPELPLTS